MSRKIENVSKEMLSDMEEFCSLGQENISKAFLEIKNNKIINRDSLKKSLLNIFSEEKSLHFVKTILRLYGTWEASDLPEDEFLNDLCDAIKKKNETLYHDVNHIKPNIRDLIKLTQIKIVYDSTQLEFSYEKILEDVEISTSIRPIFSENDNEILSSIIAHTIDINYYSESRSGLRISLLLDRDDLEKIKIACEIALKREKLIKNHQSKFNVSEEENE